MLKRYKPLLRKTPLKRSATPLARSGPIARKTPVARSTKPIAKKSAKRKADDAVYARENKKFLEINTDCQIMLPGCWGRSTAVHHLYSGKNRDKYYLVKSTWRATCAECHRIIHDVMSAEEAIKRGFKLTE